MTMPKGKATKSVDLAKNNATKVLSIADVVKAKGSLEQIETLLSQGVAIETEELSMDALQAYVKPLAKKKLHHKLLNTIEIYQNIANRQSIKELISKPHFHSVVNKKGHNLAQTLVSLGLEEECINLLKAYQQQSINYSHEYQRMWHLAVRYNCESVLAFLVANQPENIDCLDSNSLTPWCLAVMFNNARLARLLQENGANTSVFVNEEGQTLLHVAVIEEDTALLEKCLNCHVPSNVIDAQGYTPHHYARMKDNVAITDMLKKFQWGNFALLNDYFNSARKGDVKALNKTLENQFNRNARNGQGHTVLDIARIYKHRAIVAVLEDLGVDSSLSKNEILKLHQENAQPQAVSSQFKISFKKQQNGIILSISEHDKSGKFQELMSFNPWGKAQHSLKNTRWKYLIKENVCYLILMDEIQGTQPSLVCALSKTGDCNVTFANLPNSSLLFETAANVKLDGLVNINQLSISARSIESAKQFKLLNGSTLKFNAKSIDLNGEMTAKEAEIKAENNYQQSAELRAEKATVNANTVTLSGQTLVSKSFEINAKNKLVVSGNLVTGHQGVLKANAVQLDRSSSVVSQHGSIAIRASAKINNSGSIIGNHIVLDSGLMITNHMGAMIKGLHCTMHAPQVNQAGFVLSGQKPTLSYVDLTLSALHAATNVAEFFTVIPSPQAVTLRGCLLLSKTLYRGGDILYKVTQGEDVDNKTLISLVLENVLPSIGFLATADEKATLLLNVLYQFYGAYTSDDQFIYKSLEFIEALTRTLSLVSGGLLSDENLEWLQLATKILNGSRHALKLAEIGATAIRAWHNDDQVELERAQEKFKTVTEMAFREALYKLEPSQLLGSALGSTPIDLVHYIMNQGYSSELYLQSIVYGTLHAAKRTGLIQQNLESDLLFSARLLFRMKHWKELYKQFQNNQLSTHAVVNEVLNSLLVVLSSERVRTVIDEKTKSEVVESLDKAETESVPSAQSTNSVVNEKVVEAAVADIPADLEEELKEPIETAVADIPTTLQKEEIKEIIDTANNDAEQIIPEFPKQSVLIDVNKLLDKSASTSTAAANESTSVALLKSLIEVQKGFNGEYAAQGYLGAFVSALHNEGIIEVTGNVGLSIQSGTNNGLIKATQSVSVQGAEAYNRTVDNKTRSQLLAESINSSFANFESGIIDAGEAIYLTCVGIVENLGELKSLGRIVSTANRIVKNHQSGKIIAKRDVSLLCDLLAKNEGLIIGEKVHLEGTLQKAENLGTIIGVDKIRLMSSKLVSSAKDSKLVSKKVELESSNVQKEGTIQAEAVKTTGLDGSKPETVEWRKAEGDNIGVAIITASERAELDKDAFNNVQIVDVTLPEASLPSTEPLFDISTDFNNILQLHLSHSDRTIPIWQLPNMGSEATFILDAPGARLYSGGTSASYQSVLRFRGDSVDYTNTDLLFAKSVAFDVREIEGQSATSELVLKEGGYLQADALHNLGHIRSDGILDWNVDLVRNNAQLEESTVYFTYSKHNPILQACTNTSVIPNSGTIEALGHRGFVGEFSQLGGTFASGLEGTYVYYTGGTQEAILTQHGENPTGILHDAGQNWYVKPVWHNSQITSTGRSVLVGEQSFKAAGLTLWGNQGTHLHAPKGIDVVEKYQPYHIDQILSLTKSGKVNGVAHQKEDGYVVSQNHISSNSGNVTLTAPEGSIHLRNVVLTSGGDTTLVSRDEVVIDGVAVDKHSSYAYKNKGLLGSKRVQSTTDEKLIYSSFVFTGGKLVVRSNNFELDAVQGVIGGDTDVVALNTTLKGQQQTYHNTTSIKEFSIGIPGQNLASIIQGHNARAVFASIMNHSGWDQSQLDALLNAKSVAEIPQPLLHSAQNAWNVTALVAHACGELGESPADFVGAFTDRMGITVLGEDKIRHFNPTFTINTSRKTQETHSTQTISSNLFVGGTFRLLGNELHMLDGSSVDAENLRVFVIEGIKATKGIDTYKSTSENKHHHLGVSLLSPKDVSARSSKATEVQEQTQTKLAELQARNTAQVNGGELIEGDLKISAPNGGKVTAKVMNFQTSQNTRELRSHTRQGNVSTAGAVGGSYQSHKVDDAVTHEKAGVHLPGGQVLANEIHLANGSKIQAAQVLREDGQLGLPTVSGTTAQDHQHEHQRSVSFALGAQGEPSADLSRSTKEKETVHRPTIIADNVTAESLPGVNTQANAESQVVREKSSGYAVAGVIPDSDKFARDLAAIKDLRDKGLHWPYGNNGTGQPQSISEVVLTEKMTTDTLTVATQAPANQSVVVESAVQETTPGESVASASTIVGAQTSAGATQQKNIGTIDADGKLTILITRPPHWTTPPEPPSDKSPQHPSPLGDTSKFDEFIEHVDAFNRGFEKGRDAVVDAALHPIQTIADTATLAWDGANATTDLTLGLSTEGARARNAERGALLHDMAESFVEGDSVHRTEMLAELGASLVLGAASGSVTGVVTRQAAKGAMILTNNYVVTPEGIATQSLNPKALQRKREVKKGSNIHRYGTTGYSKGAEGQYWSTTKMDKHYAYDYGVPAQNLKEIDKVDIRLGGQMKPGEKFVTRVAPPVGGNPGGAIEVVTNPGAVEVVTTSAKVVAQEKPPLLFRAFDKSIQVIASEPVIGSVVFQEHSKSETKRSGLKK